MGVPFAPSRLCVFRGAAPSAATSTRRATRSSSRLPCVRVSDDHLSSASSARVFTAEEVVHATGGQLVVAGGARQRPGRVVSDSREVRSGDWFLPLKGKSFDGKDFISQALERGAGGIILEYDNKEDSEDAALELVEVEGQQRVAAAALVLVEGNAQARGLACLHGLATFVRQSFKGEVVAITGSCGKTTTRSMVSHLIRELCLKDVTSTHIVHETTGNFNNLIGMPQTLLELPREASFCVLELGMSVKGEIAALEAICKPNVRVITNVGLAHLEGVGGTIEGVAQEKAELVRSARAGDTCVLNMDDQHVSAMRPPAGVKCIRFGQDEDCDVRILKGTGCGMKTHLTLEIKQRGCGIVHADICQPGAKQMALNASAAVATLLALNIDFDSAALARALSSYSLNHPGRGDVKEYSIQQKGKTVALSVIDDSYNANPTSVEAALEMLVQSGSGKSGKHIVLGDMLELGDAAFEQHVAIVGSCMRRLEEGKVHSVGLVGDCFKKAIEMSKSSKEPSASSPLLGKISWSDNPESLARNTIASNTYQDGDVLLVKGSRGIRMERYIDTLVSNSNED